MQKQIINYTELAQQLAGLLADERHWLTNLSQFSAFINEVMEDINWVGFYLVHTEQSLKLGPFQGRVACVDIPFGKGVCGAAAATGKVQRVDDVHQFAGHIACDARSQSELVIPLYSGEQLLGVLDIDSPSLGRFSDADADGMSELTQILLSGTDWPASFV
ncbi:MAG: GAF domain-containing protein [Gammaproteobacteria bacterium]